ncbi:hypothetical protein Droror1_Dr00013487 [Drosera rotundifolia]
MRRSAAAGSAGEAKSTKKPLRDLSNNHLNRSKTVTKTKKKKAPRQQEEVVVKDEGMDRLLSVHSDLSKTLRQVDEVVVQAFKEKTSSKQAAKEIKSFASFLSDVLSSLQPWVPRIQKVLSGSSLEPENESTQSPATGVKAVVSRNVKPEGENSKPGEKDPLVVSPPSPLVSWHVAADTDADESKPLFLISPLARPETLITKGQASQNAVEFEGNIDNTPAASHSCFPNIGALDGNLLRCELKHQTSASYIDLSPDLPKISMILSTPRLKVSPPKSCVLLEPEYQCYVKNFEVTTPFSIQIENSSLSESLKPGNSSGKLTGMVDVNYPMIVGMNSSCLMRNGRKRLKTSPTWTMSPPKTCTLMELPDEKPIKDASLECSSNPVDFAPPSTYDLRATARIHGDVSRRFTLTDSIPVLKAGDDGAVGTSRHPGENTLKKELWTRFEALSTSVFHPQFSHYQVTDKGFLDLLEEASSVN